MTEREKCAIDKLVRVFVSEINSPSTDAGWLGASISARIMDYLGDPPAPTRNDQSNVAMIGAISMLREQHKDYARIAPVMRALLSHEKTRGRALAIISRHYYQGLCAWTDKVWTDKDRARAIRMSYGKFRWEMGRSHALVKAQIVGREGRL